MSDTNTTPLTRDAFVGFNKPRTRTVSLPDLGGSVDVRELTLAEAAQFSKLGGTDPAGAAAYLIRVATLTPDGSPMFAKGDDDAVKALPNKVVDDIGKVVGELSFPAQPTAKP